MSTVFNPATMNNLMEQSKDYSQTDKSWLKMKAGVYQLRICPPWSTEGSICRMLVQHWGYKNKEQQDRAPLCYNYAFTNKPIFDALVKEKAIMQNRNEKDIEIFKQLGCVYCRVHDTLKNAGQDSKAFPKAAFMWNVVNRADNKVYKWSTSKKKFDEFAMIASMLPTFTNVENGRDVMISATGDGMQRRYSSPTCMPMDSPLGVDISQIHNLDLAMAQGYCDMNTTIELIMNTYPSMLNILGINPASVMTGSNPPF